MKLCFKFARDEIKLELGSNESSLERDYGNDWPRWNMFEVVARRS